MVAKMLRVCTRPSGANNVDLLEQINYHGANGWFGGGTNVYKLSKVENVKQGVDFGSCTENHGQATGLAGQIGDK